MSRAARALDRPPFIALVDRAAHALAADMVRQSRARGYGFSRMAHNAVYGTLFGEAGRISDMAARAGITKQSMGEVVRELVGHGVLEMSVDPSDRRAKVVTYTDFGLEVTNSGRDYLDQLEQRLVEELGEDDYETTRQVLARVVELLAESAYDEDGA